MQESPPLPPHSAPDWEAFLRAHEAAGIPEIELNSLKLGDTLLVLTERTAYSLVMTGPSEANLSSNRANRPSGKVSIRGCTFGASSSVRPNHVFCGGNLEFSQGDPPVITTTTAIRAIRLTVAPSAPD